MSKSSKVMRRYRLRFILPTGSRFIYLNRQLGIKRDVFHLDTGVNSNSHQALFTEQEIKEIEEKYNLGSFVKEEAEL